MIVDVCFIGPWIIPEKIENYDILKEEIKKSNALWPLIKDEYYFEIIDGIPMPIYFVFKSYILKAREADSEVLKKHYYNMALKTYRKKQFSNIRFRVKKEYLEASPWYQKWYKPPLELLYSAEKAAEIKSKISNSMKKIDRKIIEKRNQSIATGMKKYWSEKNR